MSGTVLSSFSLSSFPCNREDYFVQAVDVFQFTAIEDINTLGGHGDTENMCIAIRMMFRVVENVSIRGSKTSMVPQSVTQGKITFLTATEEKSGTGGP